MGLIGEDSETWWSVRSALGASSEPAIAVLATAEVTWVGANGHRVDARLVDRGGVEHHLVASVASDGVVITAVFTQPEPVPPSPGVAVVVNGPSGSGKSTLMAAIARLDRQPWVVLDEPMIGTVDPVYLLWPDRTEALHRGFLDAVAALARAGVRVAVSAGGRPQADFVTTMPSRPGPVFVGLDCALATLLDRERGRDGRWGGLAEQSLGDHDGWTYDLRFDTTTLTSADGLATSVLAEVERRVSARG